MTTTQTNTVDLFRPQTPPPRAQRSNTPPDSPRRKRTHHPPLDKTAQYIQQLELDLIEARTTIDALVRTCTADTIIRAGKEVNEAHQLNQKLAQAVADRDPENAKARLIALLVQENQRLHQQLVDTREMESMHADMLRDLDERTSGAFFLL